MKIRLNIDKQQLQVKPDRKTPEGEALIKAIRARLGRDENQWEITPEQLINCVQHGRTFTQGLMHGGTENKNWRQQQTMPVDIDNQVPRRDGVKERIPNPLQPDEALAALHEIGIDPYFMYHSFNSTPEWPRYRIVLILTEALTDPALTLDLTNRLLNYLNSKRAHCADEQCKDVARMFYGGKSDCIIYQGGQLTDPALLLALPSPTAQAATPLESAAQAAPKPTTRRAGMMTLEQATEAVKAAWHSYYPPEKAKPDKGIICPLCKNGSGKGDGDGVRINPKSKNPYSLKCFGACGTAGSIIDFRMKSEGKDTSNKLEFAQTVREMAAEIGITVEPPRNYRSSAEDDFIDPFEDAPAAEQAPSFTGPTDPRPQTPTPAADPRPQRPDFLEYYEQCMIRFGDSQEAQDYVTRRGISLDVALAAIPAADNCTIGFDPKWINPNTVRKMRAAGSNWRPTPTPRLIIPVTPYHYVARDIRDPDTLTGAALENYKKFRVQNATATDAEPAAISNAEALYSGADYVFITEGPFDAMSYAEAGQPAISLNSLDNKDKLIAQLEQQPSTATLLLSLDNDKPGKEATAYLRQELKRRNISFIGVNTCGTHKDPNEALCADRAAFEQAIAKAVAGTAARPDNTATYLDNEMPDEIKKFKDAQNRRTGFSNIDEKAGGLYPGLYVLAAISSLGKTTLALQMADQIAEAGQDVLFFSMEQSRLELVSKSLARITAQNDITNAVTSLSIRRGYLPLAVQNAAEQYKAQTGGRVSIIEGNFNCDIGYITDYIHLYQQRTGTAPVVFIDYLQILQPSNEGKSKLSKREEIGKAVTELKRLSGEGLTIIVISSLNRANYLTPIAFESLKESGDIEYTADVVWGLQLACLDEDDVFEAEGKIKKKRKAVEKAKAENPRKITFTCLKNRYGISSYDCRFYYYPQYDLFVPTMDTGSAPSQARRNTAKDVTGGVRRI